MSAGPPPALFRRWVHVREEDEADVRVYRPADRPLPPARGRDGLEFRPDGTVVHFSPGPADKPVGRPATWRAAGPDALFIGASRYEIVSVTDDLLRLRATPVATDR